MTDLDFITDEQLRGLVERDRKELDGCLQHQLCKSTMLLSGSIIEAVLVDFFLAFGRTNTSSKQVQEANLAILVDWAEQEAVISPRTRELATVIKNYRNLIHPGREKRLGEHVDIRTATVAAQLVEMILEEIRESYAKRRGYTAEQVVTKLRVDPSCVPALAGHMLEKMSAIERIKLFRAIPGIVMSGDEPQAVVEGLSFLHTRLKQLVPREIVRAETAECYDLLRVGSQDEVVSRLRFFSSDLHLLPQDEKQAIVQYVLNVLGKGSRELLEGCTGWSLFFGIAECLGEEYEADVERVLFNRLVGAPSESDDVFLSVLVDEVLCCADARARHVILSYLRDNEVNPEVGSIWADRIEAHFSSEPF